MLGQLEWLEPRLPADHPIFVLRCEDADVVEGSDRKLYLVAVRVHTGNAGTAGDAGISVVPRLAQPSPGRSAQLDPTSLENAKSHEWARVRLTAVHAVTDAGSEGFAYGLEAHCATCAAAAADPVVHPAPNTAAQHWFSRG